jgi:microcystin-dependent protein
MSDPYVGEIRMTSFNFAPKGWLLCNGQILSIASNQALFSLLGTFYGGNGTQTFALPNLQGRVPVNMGQGNGLSPYVIGQLGGTETVTLLNNNMPIHNHLIAASTNFGTSDAPSGNILAQTNAGTASAPSAGQLDFVTGSGNTTMEPATFGQQGGNQSHPNIQPYLVVSFMIATVGIYPSRN